MPSVLKNVRVRVTALLVVIGLALVLVIVVARAVLVRDRDELLARFASDRAHQLDSARVEIEAELDAIASDLRLAAGLAASADSPGDIDREIGALVSLGRYRLAEVRAAGGQLRARAVASRLAAPDQRAVEPAIEATTRAALAEPGTVLAGRPVLVDGRSYRVFAVASPSAPWLAAALVVDTEPVASRLRIVAADRGTRLLILGTPNDVSPASDPGLARAIEQITAGERRSPRIEQLIERMRARASGALPISGDDGRLLGIPGEAAIAIYRPIELDGRPIWSAALLASTASITAHERAVFRKLVVVVGVIVVLLGSVSVFVVFTTRHTIRLRERLRRADEVAHLHEKANKVLDTIPTGVAVLGQGGQITAVNAALSRRLGGPPPGVVLGEAFAAADRGVIEQLEVLVEAARTSGSPRSVYAEASQLFAQEGTYNLHAVPLERRSADAEVLLVIEDLTMTGKLERQLLRAERLATVGILAAGIAHEIGTPLGVARGRAEYTLGKLEADHAMAAGQRIIIEQIDHVSRTIRRLLDFSRVQPTTSVAPVDLGMAGRGVAELLELEAARRQVTLSIDVPADCPPVAADAEQLDQVLVNLVLNAFDACDHGGTVELLARATQDGTGTVLLHVRDDGRGMADELRTQAFDPFFTTKKRGRGTGLGLAIVAQIVRNHGGTVEIDSEPGHGTTVTVRWPEGRAHALERRQYVG